MRWDLSKPITDYHHNDNGSGGKYKGKLVLRPSSIDSFIRCNYAFYKQQLEGQYGKPNAASQVGTALHAVMEDTILARLSGEILSTDEMLKRGDQHWKDLNDKADIVYHGETDFDTMATDLHAGVLALNEALECIEPTAAEGRYSVAVKDHPMFSAMSGSLDVEVDNNVVDLKFTGRKKTNPQDYVLQQSIYVWLKQLNGIPAEKFDILNIVRPTKTAKAKYGDELVADWHFLEGKANIPYVQHWVDVILDRTAEYAKDPTPENAERLFQGTSPSNSYLCTPQWCSHWDTCPHVEALREAEQFDIVEMLK